MNMHPLHIAIGAGWLACGISGIAHGCAYLAIVTGFDLPAILRLSEPLYYAFALVRSPHYVSAGLVALVRTISQTPSPYGALCAICSIGYGLCSLVHALPMLLSAVAGTQTHVPLPLWFHPAYCAAAVAVGVSYVRRGWVAICMKSRASRPGE